MGLYTAGLPHGSQNAHSKWKEGAKGSVLTCGCHHFSLLLKDTFAWSRILTVPGKIGQAKAFGAKPGKPAG